jgi:PadR family transcriptional regulator PadR
MDVAVIDRPVATVAFARGRLRRYYRLTDDGAAELAAETERRRASAAVAAQRLSARLAAQPAGGTA